jgi:hypothetical protein
MSFVSTGSASGRCGTSEAVLCEPKSTKQIERDRRARELRSSAACC